MIDRVGRVQARTDDVKLVYVSGSRSKFVFRFVSVLIQTVWQTSTHKYLKVFHNSVGVLVQLQQGTLWSTHTFIS